MPTVDPCAVSTSQAQFDSQLIHFSCIPGLARQPDLAKRTWMRLRQIGTIIGIIESGFVLSNTQQNHVWRWALFGFAVDLVSYALSSAYLPFSLLKNSLSRTTISEFWERVLIPPQLFCWPSKHFWDRWKPPSALKKATLGLIRDSTLPVLQV